MKSPARVLPLTDEEIADSQQCKQFVKHTITKSGESTCEVCTPVFSNGSLERFLKFLMLLKQAMADMNADTKINDTCREFRANARDRALSRFNSIYDMQMVDVPDAANISPENLKTMIAHVIVAFGRTNRLKCIKRHIATVSKPYGASQDTFTERMCVIQSYLQL